MMQTVWQWLKRMLGQNEPQRTISAPVEANADKNANNSTPTAPIGAKLPTKIHRIPSSIGEKSVALGYDWRDLKVAGYTDKQINGVLRGEYTLDDLFKMKPAGKPQR